MGCQPDYLVSCCFDSIIWTAQYRVPQFVPQSNQHNRGVLDPFSNQQWSMVRGWSAIDLSPFKTTLTLLQ